PERDGFRVAEARQAVDDGASRIAQGQKFRDLVESLARRVVASLAERRIREDRRVRGEAAVRSIASGARLHAEQAGVPAGDDQGYVGEERLFKLERCSVATRHFGFQKDRVDMTLEVVDADQRLPER